MPRLALATFMCVAALLSLAGSASATAFTVNDTTDAPLATSSSKTCSSTNGDSCTLRAAVQAADNTGGTNTISLGTGDYKLTIAATSADNPANGDLDVNSAGNGAAITITGRGSGATTIDANSIDRAFAVQSGGSLTLSGLTITGGKPASVSTGYPNGGAIYSDGALTLSSDVTLNQNSATATGGQGGAIYVDADATAVSISGSNLTGNKAAGNGGPAGGAIFLGLGSGGLNLVQTITNSTFTDNSVTNANNSGGAIDQEGYGPLTITGSTFTNNSAGCCGGAIEEDTAGDGTLTVTNSSFVGNSDSELGGAIDFESASLSLTGDTFSGNSAGSSGSGSGSGGAIYQYSDSGFPNSMSMVNSTFAGNSAGIGGAISEGGNSVPATFENDTIASNSASAGQGGGIAAPGYLAAGSSYVNTLVADNGAGGDCATPSGGPSYPITAGQDAGHNLDSDGTCFGANASDLKNKNPDLQALGLNGGTTETMALSAGSPAIDAGDNSHCPATDQRGVSRPQPPGGKCDIGAYEATAPFVQTGAVTNLSSRSATLNGTVNPDDQATTYFFQYGTSTAYGSQVPPTSASAGSNYGTNPEAQTVSALSPNTTYHYRIVASSALGTTMGHDETFTTPPATLRISLGRIHVKKSKVRAPITCEATGLSCQGLVRLVVVEHRRGHTILSARKRVRKVSVTVGRASYTIGPGDTKVVVVKLNAKGRALLKRFKRLKVRVVATLVFDGHTIQTATGSAKIKRRH